MALQLVTGPTSEPITVEEARKGAKLDDLEEASVIQRLITTAREMAEQETGRALMTQTWRKTLDEFPEAIRLDHPPIVSVTSVKYIDDDGVQQTLSADSYQLDSESEPGWIVPAVETSWPTPRPQANAVEVIYVAGYASAAAVPESVKQWLLLAVRAIYDRVELPEYTRGLLDRHVVPRAA